MYKALRHLEDILHVYKGHFQVDLGEFRLPVCPEILIPEAPCQLNIPIHACNHQQLLVDLGGLGQSIELARMHPGGNQIIPRPLRGGFHHHRCLDLDKIVGVEILSCRLGNLMPHDQVPLQGCPAQIQIPVLEPQLLVDLGIACDLKGGRLRLVQDPQIIHHQFHVAVFHIVVDALPFLDGAVCHQHILAPAGLCLCKQLRLLGFVECQLYHAGTIPQVNKQQGAKIAHLLHETAYHSLRADLAYLSAEMCPFQALHCIHHPVRPPKRTMLLSVAPIKRISRPSLRQTCRT